MRTGLELDSWFVQDLRRSTLVQLRSDQRAVDHEEVTAEAGSELVADLLLRVEPRRVDRRVLVNGDGIVRPRCVVPTESRRGHEDRLQDIPTRIGAEFALLD